MLRLRASPQEPHCTTMCVCMRVQCIVEHSSYLYTRGIRVLQTYHSELLSVQTVPPRLPTEAVSGTPRYHVYSHGSTATHVCIAVRVHRYSTTVDMRRNNILFIFPLPLLPLFPSHPVYYSLPVLLPPLHNTDQPMTSQFLAGACVGDCWRGGAGSGSRCRGRS